MKNTNVRFDLNLFHLNYRVNGVTTPTYRVISATQKYPSPFNTESTPFLLPCTVENFGGELAVTHLDPSGTPVNWRVTARFFRADNSIIWSQGFNQSAAPFDHLDCDVTSSLNPGTTASTGYTVLSTVGNFRDWLYQPQDFTFTPNTPVRMELTLTAFVADGTFKTPIIDTDQSNNVLDIWLMLVC
ncbi:MAG TPA: hypothetical protein VJ810_37320 [Blastocatellia bacterium]|nr:hypothetical protein [Blastocatellia bacterium]